MTRILVQVILPLLVPIAVYALWTSYDRRRRGIGGLPGWEEGNWYWAAVAGFGLVVAIFAVTMAATGNGDGTYQPARMQDGKIVPGRLGPPAGTKP